ncbi:MAG: sulfate adenylyltransferase [Planctomycetota bacterium]|nr:sulfate adenylyltransferase [Planctomycetota bacterium]
MPLPIPHGGKLTERRLPSQRLPEVARKEIASLEVTPESLADVRNIAFGRYSPLEGFLVRSELVAVLETGRLADGTPWTIPIVLDVSTEQADSFEAGKDVLLTRKGTAIAVLRLEEKHPLDKAAFARQVFGTEDTAHPGVSRLQNMGEVLLGGKIDLLDDSREPFPEYNLTPAETRALFEQRGWETVCAFQTRNAPHTGHENMQKMVLAQVDGLLVHPVIGRKKKGDFKDEVILATYEALLKNYFNPDRTALTILPMEMRYAGPREAVHHAIIRKNHGCTHFVVGRDHAGAGGFYAPEAAIDIFREYPDLGVEIITIRGDFFHCKVCAGLQSDRTCPHADTDKIFFSGTKIRQMILEGQALPPEIFRPEVFAAARSFDSPFVD